MYPYMFVCEEESIKYHASNLMLCIVHGIEQGRLCFLFSEIEIICSWRDTRDSVSKNWLELYYY